MPPRDDEVSRRALAGERLRSSRLVARIRFVGISIAFGFNWAMPFLFADGGELQGDMRLFLLYWSAAGLLYLVGRRSDRVAGLVGLDIPILDMVAAFALTRATPAWPNLVASVLAITYFALLTIAASFALVRRRVVLTAVVGTALEIALLREAGANTTLIVTLVLVMYGVATACLFVVDRTIDLVHGVATEQRRRGRLGRYFSPQVAARVESLADETSAGELRAVTVLFADLRDFTAMSRDAGRRARGLRLHAMRRRPGEGQDRAPRDLCRGSGRRRGRVGLIRAAAAIAARVGPSVRGGVVGFAI